MDLTHLLLPDLSEILENHPEQVKDVLVELHPADLAELLAQMPPDLQQKVIPYMPDDRVAEVIDHLGPGRRAPVFRLLTPEHQVRVAENMSADDRADMFANLEPEMRDAILARLPKEEAKDVRELLNYPPNTAGGLMTTDIVSISAEFTIGEVLEQVRAIADEMESVSYVYLTDKGTGKLLGVLSLRELVLNKPNRPAREVMNEKVVTVNALTDQEEVARIISKYDFLALPVVDEHEKLLGIVTVDDIVDVVVQEAGEDIQKMGAIEPFEAPYFATPYRELFRKRASWLVLIFLSEMFTSNALRHYDKDLKSVDALLWFIPLIISSGGNSGSQTATLIVRGLATGEILLKQTLRVFVSEFRMGLSLGLLLGFVGFFRATLPVPFGMHTPTAVGFVISISLVGVVTWGCMMAALMPLLLRRIGLDPAVSSAPFIATMVDVTGIVIYVHVAILFLGPAIVGAASP
jgi:magnesium transporter